MFFFLILHRSLNNKGFNNSKTKKISNNFTEIINFLIKFLFKKKEMTSNLPFKFIDELFRYLNRSEPIALARLLKIKNEQYKNIYFKGLH